MPNYSPAEPLTLATVLVISSSPTQCHGLALALADEPYEVLTVASVAAAIALLGTRMVDVVLAEHDLGGAADSELFRYLQQRQPAVIRILFGSAESSVGAIRAVRSGWAHHFLAMPCDEGDLVLTLYNSLVQRSFLPPESEGVLPTQSQPPLTSYLPARAPTSG